VVEGKPMVEWRVGIISEKWDRDWFGVQDDNPFGVLSESVVEISALGIGFDLARKYLRDERTIDWGSLAWRGSRDDFIQLARELRNDDSSAFDFMHEGKMYGLVFIELY